MGNRLVGTVLPDHHHGLDYRTCSITWEEDGAANATKEIIYSVLVAVITYFVIVNEDIRHIMFAFNEFNLVILFVVMLLGTYTGYRLTELTRFAPLAKKDGKHV